MRAILLRAWPISIVTKLYYQVRFGPIWTRANAYSKLRFETCAASIDPLQRSAVDELESEGIYISRIENYLQNRTAFQSLQKEVNTLLDSGPVQKQIRERQSKDGHKWYVVRVFGLKPAGELPKSFVEVVLNERILGIVNKYLGLWSRLLYLDVWYSFPVMHNEPSINSERWHRDNEDHRLVKLFLYLNDVNEGAGPFQYMKSTQPGGKYDYLFPAYPPRGSYPPERALERVVPATHVKICTGHTGALILCDSAGFHKGGRAVNKARLVMVATYGSNAALDSANYQLLDPKQYETLTPAARYAIRYTK